MTAARPDEHRLTFLDESALELQLVTGRAPLIQIIWVYEHPVDAEGLARFHRNFFASLAGRVIERSPLPFGRARWVRPQTPAPPIHGLSAPPRPREEMLEWADGLRSLPIDPLRGPSCYLAAQSFTDGATAVSIVAAHAIGDGVGGMMAIFEAVTGNIRNPGYDTAGARPRSRALRADLRQAMRDLPMTARTAVKAAKMLRAQRRAAPPAVTKSAGSLPAVRDDRQVVMPSAAIYIDAADWDARAESLGGNSYSLLGGFAAKLAEHLGRLRAADGKASLLIAINLRESLDDDRALAMAFATAHVDPKAVTVDLTEARDAVRAARQKAKTEPDPTIEILPLMPWLPRKAIKGLADQMFAYSEDLPVSCSNLGDLPAEISKVDGTPAEYVFVRGLDTGVTLADLERSHGQLVVVSARINGKVSITAESYQLGADNSKGRLEELVTQTLAEFGLHGVVV